jgi:hypothetical protein
MVLIFETDRIDHPSRFMARGYQTGPNEFLIRRTFLFPNGTEKPGDARDTLLVCDAETVYRWKSNGKVPPIECAETYALDRLPNFIRDRQHAAMRRELREDLAAYREARTHTVLTAEECLEARAAHGPGVILVDIITGRRFTT